MGNKSGKPEVKSMTGKEAYLNCIRIVQGDPNRSSPDDWKRETRAVVEKALEFATDSERQYLLSRIQTEFKISPVDIAILAKLQAEKDSKESEKQQEELM